MQARPAALAETSDAASLRAPAVLDPSLVSSHAGAIRRVMLAVPGMVPRNPALAAGYRSLIRALPPGTGFVVVHNRGIGETVRRWLAEAGHTGPQIALVPLDDALTITMWAADASVAVTDAAGATHLVAPWHFRRRNDAEIAEAVRAGTEIGAARAPLVFHGGNCLVGDDFWLVGRDHLDRSARLVAEAGAAAAGPRVADPEERALRLFRRHLDGRRWLVPVGVARPLDVPKSHGVREGGRFVLDVPTDGVGIRQPVFHIDMMATLVGRGTDGTFTVMVASPALGDRMLGTVSPFALHAAYDAVAHALAAAGFRVLRNPLVHRPKLCKPRPLRRLRALARAPSGAWMRPGLARLAALGAGDDDPVVPRYWYHVSWNNCLVEDAGPGRRRVYLPTYGHGADAELAVVDRHMAALWRAQGYRPVLLGDFLPFAKHQGALHCIAKVLARGTAG